MAKKLSRAKRRVNRRPAKKSWLESLFTFPKVVAYAIVALSVVTLYQVVLPVSNVKGVSTANYDIITDTQYESLKNSPSSVEDYPRYVYSIIWIDDGDAKKESNETKCPEKTYTIKKNGTEKTITQKPKCKFAVTHVSECNQIAFISKLKNYTLTGIQYTDKYGFNHTLKGASKISFCGGELFEGGWSRDIYFGLKPK